MKPLTRQQAINAKCKDCIYDPKCGKGTWREQVAQCTISDCPLWPHRPSPRSGQWVDPPRDPAAIPPGWPHEIPISAALEADQEANA